MKIVIEEGTSSINMRKNGFGQYLINIVDILNEKGINPIMYKKNFLKINNRILKRILYFLWLNTVFLFRLMLLKDDVIVLGTAYFLPSIKIPRVKYYPVIHDLIAIQFPRNITKINAFIFKFYIENAIRMADRILTISEHSKKLISQYYNYNEDNIFILSSASTLISENVSIDNDNEILEKYNIKSKQYILSVSSMSEHKNIKTLISAYKNLSKQHDELKLVLVGPSENNPLRVENQDKNIVFTGIIEEYDLRVLYKNAKLYAFPSLMEGFGLPIIDAQYFNVPIICSNIDIFKEVAGEKGAFFVEPTEQGLQNGIEELLNDEKLQMRLIGYGKENLKRFSKECRIVQFEKILESARN